MSRPRFHLPPEELAQARVSLPGAELRHAQVRRVRVGDEVSLFDGQGGEAKGRVIGLGRQTAEVEIIGRLPARPGPAVKVHLGLGLLRWERLRLAVEKATELGAASLWPLLTGFSQPAIVGLKEKLAKVVIEALKQCQGSFGPTLESARPLSDFLAHAPGQRLVLDSAGRPWPEVAPTLTGAAEVSLLVGPEGGLSPAELAAAVAAGFETLSLGPRLLRAETAALVALALLVNLAGQSARPEAR